MITSLFIAFGRVGLTKEQLAEIEVEIHKLQGTEFDEAAKSLQHYVDFLRGE